VASAKQTARLASALQTASTSQESLLPAHSSLPLIGWAAVPSRCHWLRVRRGWEERDLPLRDRARRSFCSAVALLGLWAGAASGAAPRSLGKSGRGTVGAAADGWRGGGGDDAEGGAGTWRGGGAGVAAEGTGRRGNERVLKLRARSLLHVPSVPAASWPFPSSVCGKRPRGPGRVAGEPQSGAGRSRAGPPPPKALSGWALTTGACPSGRRPRCAPLLGAPCA
jgi:hypothetical protein